MRTHDRFGAVISVHRPVAQMVHRYCTESGCDRRVEGRRRLCDKHRAEHAQVTRARKIQTRDKAAELQARCARYGITLDQYEATYLQQNGRCFICGGLDNDRSLAIDHDHGTGKVRGLLCSPCNRALGLLMDDPERARAAARYLEIHQE